MHKRFRHLCLALAALIAAGTLLAALIPAAEAATYKKGSSGAVVSQIQTKLKNWGYYAGDVDGIYGSATERAVRAFQRKNGLTADGKAGAQTLEALGLPGGQRRKFGRLRRHDPARRSICLRASSLPRRAVSRIPDRWPSVRSCSTVSGIRRFRTRSRA